MAPYAAKDESICICCGWVRYAFPPLTPLPLEKDLPKRGRGSPFGYIKSGPVRMD